jgi:hypothetical protein
MWTFFLNAVSEKYRVCFNMPLSVVIAPVLSLAPPVHPTDALRMIGFIRSASAYKGTRTNTSLLGRRCL